MGKVYEDDKYDCDICGKRYMWDGGFGSVSVAVEQNEEPTFRSLSFEDLCHPCGLKMFNAVNKALPKEDQWK